MALKKVWVVTVKVGRKGPAMHALHTSPEGAAAQAESLNRAAGPGVVYGVKPWRLLP